MAKGRIVINEAICKGCELCIPVCPHQLIELAHSYNASGYRPARLVDPEQRCTGCTLCAIMCPEAAITVWREVKIKPAPLSATVVTAGQEGAL